MRYIPILSALALATMGGCDSARFDNRYDPAGSAPAPVSIEVRKMPLDPRVLRAHDNNPMYSVHVVPHSGEQVEGLLQFSANSGQGLKFEFWKGPGIEGDTRPSLQVRIQDGAVYEAWFSDTWMDYGQHTAIENGQVLPVGTTWYGYLSTSVHAMSKGRIPLRAWRVVRSSPDARIEPVDSAGGSLLTIIDTTILDAASKLMRFRLRPHGGTVCLGQELGADGVGLDLREMRSFLPLFHIGRGALTATFAMRLDGGRAVATRRIALPGTGRYAPNILLDSFAIVDASGKTLQSPWSQVAERVVSFDLCASGTDEFDGAIGNIDWIGGQLRSMVNRIGGVR